MISPGLVSVARARGPGYQTPPAPLGADLFSAPKWAALALSLKLSSREGQIVRGIFNAQKEYTIAVDLGVSPQTVHTHCKRLYHKLNVNDRVGLVLRVMEEFLAPPTAPGTRLSRNTSATDLRQAGLRTPSAVPLTVQL